MNGRSRPVSVRFRPANGQPHLSTARWLGTTTHEEEPDFLTAFMFKWMSWRHIVTRRERSGASGEGRAERSEPGGVQGAPPIKKWASC